MWVLLGIGAFVGPVRAWLLQGFHQRSIDVGGVPSREDGVVSGADCGDLRVGSTHRTTGLFSSRDDEGVGRPACGIERQHKVSECLDEQLLREIVDLLAASARGYESNTRWQLCRCDRAGDDVC